MAYWWSDKANGKNIFYKLPEHLATHFAVYKNHLFQKETMVASQKQREANEKRIRSKSYVAKVLPPLMHSHSEAVLPMSSLDISDIQMAEPDGSSLEPMALVDDISMEHLQATLRNPNVQMSGLTGTIASSSSVQLSSQTTGQAFSTSDIQQKTVVNKQSKKKSIATTAGAVLDSFTIMPPGHYKKQCRVCVDAGRNGSNCPGSGNRSRCIYRYETIYFADISV